MLAMLAKATRILRRLVKLASGRYPVRKSLILFILLFYACLATIITVVTQGSVGRFSSDTAQALRNIPYGYMLMVVVMIVVSFPPFIGHGPLIHLFGFTYGMWGFIPAAAGTLLASVIVFATLRMMFGKKPRVLTPANEKWKALEDVIRSKGMPLIILVRMSSLVPWAWSNSLFASIASVSLLQFFIATWFVLPRVFIYVVVGAIFARLSDNRRIERIHIVIRILSSILIVSGILFTFSASSLVYYFVQKEIKRLRVRSSERDETVVESFKATEETPFSESTV